MPRKKLIYTNAFPYHIVGRSNNKEWFRVPKDQLFEIFVSYLNKLNELFAFQVHVFELLDNHYHLIGTTSENHDLSIVMHWFQMSVSRIINSYSGRQNHVFGGPYRATLITHEIYYYHAFKYVYRNAVKAKQCKRVEDYKFSSLRDYLGENKDSKINIITPADGIDGLIPKPKDELLLWLNNPYTEKQEEYISKGLQKSQFKFPKKRCRSLCDLVQLPKK